MYPFCLLTDKRLKSENCFLLLLLLVVGRQQTHSIRCDTKRREHMFEWIYQSTRDRSQFTRKQRTEREIFTVRVLLVIKLLRLARLSVCGWQLVSKVGHGAVAWKNQCLMHRLGTHPRSCWCPCKRSLQPFESRNSDEKAANTEF